MLSLAATISKWVWLSISSSYFKVFYLPKKKIRDSKCASVNLSELELTFRSRFIEPKVQAALKLLQARTLASRFNLWLLMYKYFLGQGQLSLKNWFFSYKKASHRSFFWSKLMNRNILSAKRWQEMIDLLNKTMINLVPDINCVVFVN